MRSCSPLQSTNRQHSLPTVRRQSPSWLVLFLGMLGLLLITGPLSAGTIMLTDNTVKGWRGWQVESAMFDDQQLKDMFEVGAAPESTKGPLPLTLTLEFTNMSPIDFVFTYKLSKADFIADGGSTGNAIDPFSRFSLSSKITNATKEPWSGFYFSILDNITGKPPLDNPDREIHPKRAHFHAGKDFANSLDPFEGFDRTPTPRKPDYGFSLASVFGGELPDKDDDFFGENPWSPKGLGMHDNNTFDKDGKATTSFTLSLQPAPEPASLALFGLGALGVLAYRRFRAKRKVEESMLG